MVPSVVLFVVALFWGNVLAQGDMNACAKGCVVNIFADPSRLGCKLEDKNCACHSGDNLKFGVRDCITQACGLTGDALNAQVAASDTYTNEQCQPFTAAAAPPATTAPPAAPAAPAPAASPATTAPPAPAPAPTTADPAKTDTASPEAKVPSATGQPATGTQADATSGANSQPTTGASAASADSPSDTVNVSSAASSHAAGVAASTASPTSSKDASKETEDSNEGLSVAAKAGIGAGAGVVVVMAAITLCCIMMRRRRDSRNAAKSPTRPTRSPLPCNISKPVAGGRHYAEDVESPAALDFPFPATAPVMNEKSSNSSLRSPKAAYQGRSSHDDKYSVRGNRYEDMLPRTQPRTMI
ncbi:hypothetical protein PG994_006571 [Apiospora phragmitis]|uniref:CFEM domain-containing protein n=1 Tax=Apiospora phragmitis TaxID=2905665 RepID=A0ABR1VFF2_9PEZI